MLASVYVVGAWKLKVSVGRDGLTSTALRTGVRSNSINIPFVDEYGAPDGRCPLGQILLISRGLLPPRVPSRVA